MVIKAKQRLRSKVWWAETDRQVEAKTLHGCQLVGLPEPMKFTKLSSKPWHDPGTDLIESTYSSSQTVSRYFDADTCQNYRKPGENILCV